MLSHIDENNMPRMVDVGAKDDSERVATASGIIRMSAEAFAAVKQNTAKKRSRASNRRRCRDNGR